jgi:hypothetical protein
MVVASVAQIQTVGSSGSIDWNRRVVIATGIGAPPPNVPAAAARPNAIRAAQMVAMRNALETVKGMFVSSTSTVENAMVINDAITSRINGYIKTFEQKGNIKYMIDGSLEITYEITIGEEMFDALLPIEVQSVPSIKSMPVVSAPKMVFTGLIIDCSGLKVTPAIAPKILDEDGKELYGSAYVSREWATKYGMAGYAKNAEQAASLKDRIGENPGMVKALRVTGANKTDVVLEKKDADSIRSAVENLKFLSECRVIIIVD